MSETQFSLLKFFELVFTISMGERGGGGSGKYQSLCKVNFLTRLSCRIFSLGYNYCPVHTEIYGTYRARYLNVSSPANCIFPCHVQRELGTKLKTSKSIDKLTDEACTKVLVNALIRDQRCRLISTHKGFLREGMD